MTKPIIAIDGPAASGKGTLARKIAERLNFAHLDTGSLYRIAALYMVQHNLEFSADNVMKAGTYVRETVSTGFEPHPDLRLDEVGLLASRISALPELRELLLDLQRDFAAHPPAQYKGAVLDGRDIGTVVCPDADIKLYVTADVETRADRRQKELMSRGHAAVYEDILQDMQERDNRDMNREIAPLKPAHDAIIIDTSELTAEEALAQTLGIVKKRVSSLDLEDQN